MFEAALGVAPPWFVAGIRFDETSKVLTVGIDFTAGSRFAAEGATGEHSAHDTVTKIYRRLNFFQHECVLQVRTPCVKLPDGTMRLVKPTVAGKLSGLTLLFEALVLMPAPQMPFAALARIVGVSAVLAIDETSRARGHGYITLAADAVQRRELAVADGREAKTVAAIAAELDAHGYPPAQIESVSIDMWPACIKGCTEQLPNASITFEISYVVWHANAAVDKMRRIEAGRQPVAPKKRTCDSKEVSHFQGVELRWPPLPPSRRTDIDQRSVAHTHQADCSNAGACVSVEVGR